jgi:hypothetical protein
MGEKRHTSCATLVAVIVVGKWREPISAALRLRIILTGRMLVFTVVYMSNWCQLEFHRDGPIRRFAINSNVPPNLHLPCKKNLQTSRPPRPNMLAVGLDYVRIQVLATI